MAKNLTKRIRDLENTALMLYYVGFLRFFFFFYALMSFVFWFLNCFEVDWLYHFNSLFIIPYKFVKLFYNVEGVAVDFSLAIIGGISLALGFFVDFIVNNVNARLEEKQELLERKLQQRKLEKKKIMAQKAAAAAKAGSEATEYSSFEESKLIFIVQPHIKKIKRKESDLELTFQEVELWKQRINKRLIENLNYSNPIQKGYYRKNLFLIYKDFNYVDDFVYYIKPTTDSITLEFKKYGISIYYNYVLSSLSNSGNLEKELDCMDTILSLNFKNEYVVTNRFKITYDYYKQNQRYELKLKGEYNLSKNLSVTNRQALYSLEEKEKIGDENGNENENNKNGA